MLSCQYMYILASFPTPPSFIPVLVLQSDESDIYLGGAWEQCKVYPAQLLAVIGAMFGCHMNLWSLDIKSNVCCVPIAKLGFWN